MAFVSPIPLHTTITRNYARSQHGTLSFSNPTRASLERSFAPVHKNPSKGAPSMKALTAFAASPSTLTSDCIKPGIRDDKNFKNGSSVKFWRTLNIYGIKNQNEIRKLIYTHMQKLLQSIFNRIRSDPQHAFYYIYHIGRTTFFALHGYLTLLSGTINNSIPSEFAKQTADWGSFAVLIEAGYVFQQDLKYIRSRKYKMPWDVIMGLRHQQMNPFNVFQQTIGFLKESGMWLKKTSEKNNDFNVWLGGNIYPEYYKQTYHYQTDGWMSSLSANIYDFNTETLFVGRQDAMQRLTLLAFKEYFKSTDFRGKRIVEIGAGTGRFATFVRDNYPDVDLVLSDLSPFYLQKARETMNYWEQMRGNRHMRSLGSIQYLQAAAEDLPLPDASVDVLFSVYLFHELPPIVRRAVVKEAARVIKPGGLFVITDSIQLGDRPGNDPTLPKFGEMNEPWYLSYITEDFGGLVTEHGKFATGTKEISSVSKTLSFRRTNV